MLEKLKKRHYQKSKQQLINAAHANGINIEFDENDNFTLKDGIIPLSWWKEAHPQQYVKYILQRRS